MLSELAARENADAQYLLGTLILADLRAAGRPQTGQFAVRVSRGNGQARAAYALPRCSRLATHAIRWQQVRWLARAAELGDPGLARHAAAWRPAAGGSSPGFTDRRGRRAASNCGGLRDATTSRRCEVLATAERVNAADDFGRTALHHAADGGAAAAIALLLARGAKVEAIDEFGVTPLDAGLRRGAAGSVRLLLQARASVTAVDHSGNTALAYAVRSGRAEQARNLQAAGSVPVRTSISASTGPVDHLPRATPSMPTQVGRTWSWRRAARILTVCVNCWLAAPIRMPRHPADGPRYWRPWTPSRPLPLSCCSRPVRMHRRGCTGRHAARLRQCVVEMRHSGRAAAASRGRSERARCRRVDRPCWSQPRETTCAPCGCCSRSGADANASGPTGKTPLMVAAARDESDIAGLLLVAHASPSATDSSTRSALWFAACGNSTATVPILVKAGAAIDVVDEEGVTPWHVPPRVGTQQSSIAWSAPAPASRHAREPATRR